MTSDKSGDIILKLEHITKTFPGVKALDDVSFELRRGEIHALMGENGAGKSTFIKVITGVHRPDTGDMYLDGEKVRFESTRDSMKAGIACIYQHSTAYPDLSVAENIFLGHEIFSGKLKRLNWASMHARAKELLDSMGVEIDTKQPMGELSVAQQQIVEIAKALSTDARIIIMDEPTAALTKQESEDLYKYTRRLQKQNVSIIFISHRFEDMYELAERVTVLRDAQYIGTWDVDKISDHDMIVAMVGREIQNLFPKRSVNIGDVVLDVNGLCRTGYFKDVSLNVREGEIVALTGLVGAGRSEVAEAIFGIMPADAGGVSMKGKALRAKSAADCAAEGIGLLPEDRQRQALILDWEISKNIGLGNLDKFTKSGGVYDEKAENEEAQSVAEQLNVKASSIFDKVSSLSGGNQQKVVVAKMMTSDLKLIIMDEPTKGVDVGAKAAIYEIMGDLSEKGYGILLISSEMPEVLGMSDRIYVMKSGRVAAEFITGEATQEQILEAAILSGTAVA
ncbi:MAG: sugar ABC transporter ATP-binding protein [Clostridiales Family XIII bacterium]|jgi:rhamnose transport system ATP-binding protein|nr:sugar ABC transporter ATP-binding protein [Clostridiales Family XIII bacterium]